MALGAALAGAGALPAGHCAAYDAVWGCVMPLASALLVLETRDMSRLHADGGRVLAAFAVGGAGMFAGALAAAQLAGASLPLAAAACLCASYIGGSVNFLACAQALGLPPASLPPVMAADNLAMGVLLAALLACPLRLVRRAVAPDTVRGRPGPGAAAATKSAEGAAVPKAQRVGGGGGGGGGGAGPHAHAGGGAFAYAGAAADGGDGGMAIAAVQAALQRQVAVPARFSGQAPRLVARDGSALLTEEPAAAAVWAAYVRSRDRATLPGSGTRAGGAWDGVATPAAAPAARGGNAHGRSGGGNGTAPAVGAAAAAPAVSAAPAAAPYAPVIPPEYAEEGSGSDSPGDAIASLDGACGGPLARDGGPLLTAEPSPLVLQAAYARSRDSSSVSSIDSGDDAAGARDSGGRLTARSAALSLAGAAACCVAARLLAGAFGAPHLFLLAVSGAALAGSAAGGWRGRVLFCGASRLGAPLMGAVFAAVGAACSAAGVSPAAMGPPLGFIAAMVAVHWAVLVAGARALRLEPSAVLIASNALIGGPATAAGMAASRGWGRLVQPAMLCGSLSYGVGSAAGLLLALILGGLA